MGTMTIDGRKIEFTDEKNVLSVIRKAGINIASGYSLIFPSRIRIDLIQRILLQRRRRSPHIECIVCIHMCSKYGHGNLKRDDQQRYPKIDCGDLRRLKKKQKLHFSSHNTSDNSPKSRSYCDHHPNPH